MLVSDKWNPRLWLRDWMNQPSRSEAEERRVAEAAAQQMLVAFERQARAADDSALAASHQPILPVGTVHS